MWEYDLAKKLKEINADNKLEKKYYKGTYNNGQIVLYGGRIKFDLNRCDMAFNVRYQLQIDFYEKSVTHVPRTWNDGDQCWCLIDAGSVLIIGMA